jgi:hypothetical protein
MGPEYNSAKLRVLRQVASVTQHPQTEMSGKTYQIRVTNVEDLTPGSSTFS